MRSDSRPHSGANRNCIAEKLDISRPIVMPGRRSELLGVDRQQRQHHAEAEQVDEDREKDDEQRSLGSHEAKWERGTAERGTTERF